MIIYIEIEKNRTRHYSENIDKKILYYDCKSKKMLTFSGSHLKFKYDFKSKSSIPYVDKKSDVLIRKEDNKQEVLDFINKNTDLISINKEESSYNRVAIEFSKDNEQEVLSILEDTNFRYE